jgi:hypothetical protein
MNMGNVFGFNGGCHEPSTYYFKRKINIATIEIKYLNTN